MSPDFSPPTVETPVRQRRKEARPGELAAAAMELFVEKGFAATRLEDIAARLGVSDHTAKFHVNAILAKLGAGSRAEAIVQAARMGLVAL